MIIIVTDGEKDENRHIPSFTVQGKGGMWCFIWGTEDKTCPNTEENMSANVILECFLKINNIHRNKAMKHQDEEDIPCTCM